MKKVALTKGQFTLVDDRDYELVSQFKWCYQICGKSGYAARKTWNPNLKRVSTQYMHRLIMNPPPDKQIDHINMNRLDNRRQNLRICERWDNIHNKPSSRPNTSGYRGVFKGTLRKWYAFINYEGKRIYIRGFDTPEDAAHIYNVFSRGLYGVHGWQNTI